MDITKPPAEYLQDIDSYIKQLEEEAKNLDSKYGFKGINEAESLVALKRKQKKAAQPKQYQEDRR